MKGRKSAMEATVDIAIMQAWHTGRFSQADLKRYPSLKRVLQRGSGATKEATPEQREREMNANLRAWSMVLKGMDRKRA